MDGSRYRELLLRAVHEVLQPLGVTDDLLRVWLFSRAGYCTPPGLIHSPQGLSKINLPLFASTEAVDATMLH